VLIFVSTTKMSLTGSPLLRTFPAAVMACAMLALATPPARADPPGVLRWGGDSEGGAPYVEADPKDPSRLVGFDVEVADVIARGLGRTPQFVFVGFASIEQSVVRGDFDIGMSGIEDTPARRATLAVTLPYYEFREVLTVRAGDRDRFRTLAALRGRKVATLAATQAYDILLDAERRYGVIPVAYDDDVHPYGDMLMGRVDAVLLDNVIAGREERRRKGLYTQPDPVQMGHYVGVLTPSNTALRDRINQVLLAAMADGSLERIFRKWGLWNDDQPALYARLLAAGKAGAPPPADSVTLPGASLHTTSSDSWLQATRNYLPALLRASLLTIVLSCLAMALAVAVGILVATGRVYGGWLLRTVLIAYVEITRGTPVLLQLFVLYYGLASVVRLPAFVAALLGLGLNYAAYESEIYRGALEAVPTGQLEAARTLGFTESQVLRLVRGPQAFRLALPPMTNDFVALLKDSSLVSVITVVELTKQTQIFATNLGSWVVPGALCAALYLAMSLPLARLARRLEARWKAPTA
jgi:polar amino acid transport system substrate-binding protein